MPKHHKVILYNLHEWGMMNGGNISKLILRNVFWLVFNPYIMTTKRNALHSMMNAMFAEYYSVMQTWLYKLSKPWRKYKFMALSRMELVNNKERGRKYNCDYIHVDIFQGYIDLYIPLGNNHN